MRKYLREGEPFVWATAATLALTLIISAVLIVVVLVNGFGVFWPSKLAQVSLTDGQKVMGEIIRTEEHPDGSGLRYQFKTGNRDLYGLDFRWISQEHVTLLEYPEDAVGLERQEYGNFYGYLKAFSLPEGRVEAGSLKQQYVELLPEVQRRMEHLDDLQDEVMVLSRKMQKIDLETQELLYESKNPDVSAVQELGRREAVLKEDFATLLTRQNKAMDGLEAFVGIFVDAAGKEKNIPLSHIVRFYEPNNMNVLEKLVFYLGKLVELIFGEPRESNTEGGLFPAIFGTVVLIFLMSIISFPLGVIAAVYLREYSKEGPVVRLVRIAVNNLAGIPSIVYGIFGLAFFVYGIGGSIDALFFPERLPNPTFGTGGILWASLTLSLLTVPVVIVSTDEALGAIPGGIREGSLALGSTKFQTLMRILLPMASPGIMTGFILAMARAAGEVAPLMITGVVKLAPALPIDGVFPFIHLERKFMHLGFHIFDIGFQSPNVEAAKPMVYITTLLLVLVVLLMSSVAIVLRNRMKKRYTYGTF